ncbi:MAG: AMP-binding protein [Candidatus Thorarchaeota archaeon]
MTSLVDFKVNGEKVWFGEYWPKGVPNQIYEVEGAVIEPLFQGFMRCATERDFWDKEVCIAVFGPYIEKITFRDLINKAKRFGTFLYDLGIRKGDVVAIELPNSINFVIAYMGTIYIGAIMAGINPTYKPMELMHALNISEAKVLVVMDALYSQGPNTVLSKTNVKYVISTNLLDFVTAELHIFAALRNSVRDFQSTVPKQTDDYKVYRMKEIVLETEPKEISIDIDPWIDPAAYLMTGGTTGLPKAAMLSHANLIVNLYQQRDWVQLETGMINIGIIPFFHSFGLTSVMNGSLFLGMVMLLFPKPPEVKDLCEMVKKLEAPQKIIYAGVELLFKRLIDFVVEMGEETFKQEYDMHKKLKYASQGAGPLHDYVRIPFEKTFCPIRTGYGLTETSPVVSSTPFWGPNKVGKIGLPIPGTDVAIFDAENFELGPICDGTPEMEHFGIEYTGEICVSGPQVMLGYKGEQKEQEDNLKTWNGKRWLLTGDIGFMDEYGFLEIRDRKKSLIKIAGHSVFPKEVEQIMGKNPMVNEVAVAGLPDIERGETVKAWVTLKPEYTEGIDITSEQLKKWCEENMARWKCPNYIEFIKELPVSTTGKVERRVLQENDLNKIKEGKEIKG